MEIATRYKLGISGKVVFMETRVSAGYVAATAQEVWDQML